MMPKQIDEAPEYIPHSVLQCITAETCEGELTPDRIVNTGGGYQAWAYKCDQCGEEILDEDILVVLNDYEYTGD
jgi:hypothetical protein